MPTGETETMRSEADTVSPAPITDPEPSLNPEGTEGENAEGTKDEPTFGGISAREAGLRSGEARRRKARARDEDAVAQSTGQVILVRTPVNIGEIIGRLAADAKRGSTQAARELRSYLEAYPAEDATDMSVLDKRTRQQVIARLLADIEADEGQRPTDSGIEGGPPPGAMEPHARRG